MVAKKKKRNNKKKKNQSRTMPSLGNDNGAGTDAGFANGRNTTLTTSMATMSLRNNNGAAAAKSEETTATTMVMTTTPMMTTCCHGSTAEKFNDGFYKKIIDEWCYLHLCVLPNDENENEEDIVQHMASSPTVKFFECHKNLLENPEFGNYVFAFVTQTYLKNPFVKDYLLKTKMCIILTLGFYCREYDTEKTNKYCLDMRTDRGIINVLYRETSSFCHCMKAKKLEAKTMEKMGRCDGCLQLFPKMELRRCTRCHVAKFCTNQCLKNNWSNHKLSCTRMSQLLQLFDEVPPQQTNQN